MAFGAVRHDAAKRQIWRIGEERQQLLVKRGLVGRNPLPAQLAMRVMPRLQAVDLPY